MNPLKTAILISALAGLILTSLVYFSHSNKNLLPEQDIAQAQTNANLLSEQLNSNLASLNSAIDALSFNAFWQATPVSEWSFWLSSQKPLYTAAGLSLLGVHAKSNNVMYFEKASLPGQFAEIKTPLTRMYQTESSVSLLQIFRGEPAILILTPIKNIESQVIGAIVGVKFLNSATLKSFHYLTKVKTAVVQNGKIEAVSVDNNPALQDYQLVEVTWPKSINSSLWSLVLLVSPPPTISLSNILSVIALLIAGLATFLVATQVKASQASLDILDDTLDLQLPVNEQIQRLETLSSLTKDPKLSQVTASIKQRIEQLLQQKKSLSLELRKYKESEAAAKAKVTALKQERDTAFAAPKLKSEFLSRMGDEITTPMKSVVSMLKLLSEYQFESEPRQLLNIAKRSTRTLVDNLNNILDFSKLDAGMLRLKPKSFSVRELVDELSSEISHYANDKGLSLQASTDPEVPASTTSDEARIRQILRNLLGNAVRFTKEGEVSLYADLVTKESQKFLRFTIKDSGVGIPFEAQKGLFDSLEQSTKLTNSSFAGRLRLIVSKNLAELMGGEIGVISEPGKGSQFWFTIRLDE
ncbi:ATP-binding protein [Aliikangiella sp. IMCC44632]